MQHLTFITCIVSEKITMSMFLTGWTGCPAGLTLTIYILIFFHVSHTVRFSLYEALL